MLADICIIKTESILLLAINNLFNNSSFLFKCIAVLYCLALAVYVL